jgi:hypothetical protein
MIIEKGYILLARNILESEISKKPPHFREIWIWLLQKANHAPRNIKGTLINRGQLLASRPQIIEALSWETGKYTLTDVQCAFRFLIKRKMIETNKSTRTMIVTICNYDDYQTPANYQVHNQSINKPQSVHNQFVKSPDDKQKQKNYKNYNNSKMCVFKENTHTFFRIDVEKLFSERETVLGKQANMGAVTKFYDNYNIKGWMNDGKPIEDLIPFVDQWINTDDEKRPKVKRMVIKLPERYKTIKESTNDF